MRYMIIVKATRYSEAGIKPSQERVEAMKVYNEELAKAGVLLAEEKLYPSSSGMRITYSMPEDSPNITVGPFAEARELVAGFTLIEVNSVDEAYEWAIRMPNLHRFGESEIELRQVYEAEETLIDPKIQAMENELRELIQPIQINKKGE